MRIILRLGAAISTFVVGCATFFLVSTLLGVMLLDPSLKPVDIDRNFLEPGYPGALPRSAQSRILDYCEVATNPEYYSGRLVSLKANMTGDDHGIFFYGPGCETQRTAGQLTAMGRHDYDKLMRKACTSCDYRPVEVLGRFEYGVRSNASDLNWDTMPMHLELLRVREASKSR